VTIQLIFKVVWRKLGPGTLSRLVRGTVELQHDAKRAKKSEYQATNQVLEDHAVPSTSQQALEISPILGPLPSVTMDNAIGFSLTEGTYASGAPEDRRSVQWRSCTAD